MGICTSHPSLPSSADCWPVGHDGTYQDVFSKLCYSAGAWSKAPSPHWSFLDLEESQRAGQRKNAHRRWEGKSCCVPSLSTPRGPAQDEACPHLSLPLQKHALLLCLPRFSPLYICAPQRHLVEEGLPTSARKGLGSLTTVIVPSDRARL